MKVLQAVLLIFPALTPIPTAWLIGRATAVHLGWPLWVAAIAALIVEGLGFSAIATALVLRAYNKSKRKSDPIAPYWIALLMVAVYFVAAIGLTVMMDIVSGLALYAPAVFPVFSLCGMTIAALLYDHLQRVNGIEQDKAERKQERIMRKDATHSAPIQIFRCDQCGKLCDSSQKLAAHVRWQHAKVDE